MNGNDAIGLRGSARAAGRAFALDRWLAVQLLRLSGHPPIRIRLWDGQEVSGARAAGRSAGGPPASCLVLRDRGALYRLLRFPDLEFGELYSAGRIEVQGDLVGFLEAVYRALSSSRRRHVVKSVFGWRYRARRNTFEGSRDHIHHHYDIGNSFYRLWLDEQMVYTCAYFPDAVTGLEDAQIAKLDHVCRKLRLKAGEEVVEAGCGWGALALHMARAYGVRVRAYNISHEQILYARERARREGLEGRVEFIEGDYRTINGRYDVFVSVGMLEHVGVENYATLGRVIERSLKPHGRGLIHSIGRNHPAPMNAWIEKRIFPGGHPPSLGEMAHIFEPHGFSVLDVENLRLHYARTLEHWSERFEAAAGRVEKMFDADFVRMWRLYLAGSLAAFRSGDLQLFQVLFAREHSNDIPLTRAHLYTGVRPPG